MTSIAAIHAGRKQLGLDENTMRDLYERVTGERSLRAMSCQQQEAVVSEFRRLGFGRTAPKYRRLLDGPFAKKLQALWIAAWNLGVVANREDKALLAFVKRQTGIDHVRFLRYPQDAAKAIEALKGWLARDGGVDWARRPTRYTGDHINLPQYRIALAQWEKLNNLDPAHPLVEGAPNRSVLQGLAEAASRLGLPEGYGRFEGQDWQALMNHLGSAIRREPPRR
ncbi:uncharacterized protein DUF1018 [Hoeflea marina]|uniref:Uncharacterized protein DUF1018 n=1 Tax=Hoeflea marina TaxID=274592 RepID=A0A317PE36_9HYPH|nr:regulatory protein GemA [Hoeflea marina]PWV97728.1 uncharacterized protein DUF1018 [Hoeflea marina]